MFFSVLKSFKKAVLYTFLYSFSAALVQYYWIGFVTAEGLWHLILIGLVLISVWMGSIYLAAGMLFRVSLRTTGRLYIFIFPAVWVCIDYLRTLGDLSFPWSFLGYSLTPFLPLAQFATLTGVWGLTYLIVLGNILIRELFVSFYQDHGIMQKWLHILLFVLCIAGVSVWGTFRMNAPMKTESSRISLIQTNIDQFHWGNNSLDSAFLITETMVKAAARSKPDLIIGPESALLCYLKRRPDLSSKVFSWADSIRTPILLGALDWDKASPGSAYEYNVYNSAFLAEPDSNALQHYNKTKLVPFSEIMPFENLLPILSRVNLGEADFHRGNDPVVFSVNNKIKAAPFICYEIIFPSFVQNRLKDGANLIATITNDGWFGKTSGPYQHAIMARMRAIENRVSVVRCANSGISMLIDPFGRILKKSGLYLRTIVDGDIQLKKADTFYSKHGDWFVVFSLLMIISGTLISLLMLALRKGNPSRFHE
jgi:apolipoprotein N-acyltransferase